MVCSDSTGAVELPAVAAGTLGSALVVPGRETGETDCGGTDWVRAAVSDCTGCASAGNALWVLPVAVPGSTGAVKLPAMAEKSRGNALAVSGRETEETDSGSTVGVCAAVSDCTECACAEDALRVLPVVSPDSTGAVELPAVVAKTGESALVVPDGREVDTGAVSDCCAVRTDCSAVRGGGEPNGARAARELDWDASGWLSAT